MTTTAIELREQVRRRYAEAARAVSEATGGECGCGSGSCCADDERGTPSARRCAAEERGGLPEAAVLASLGCGNPTAVADLHEGGPCSISARAAGST